MKSRIFLAAALILVIATAGCVNERQNTTQAQQEPVLGNYTPPSGVPTLEIIYPKNGDVVNSSTVGIKANVTNFRLVGIVANLPNKQNEGHIHYVLDGAVHMSPYISDSFANLQPGTHTLRIELVNNNHAPLSPPVFLTVRVTTTG